MEQDQSTPVSESGTPASAATDDRNFLFDTSFGTGSPIVPVAAALTKEAPAEGTADTASKLSGTPPTDTPAEGAPAAEPSNPEADKVEASKPGDSPTETAEGRRASARARDEAEKAELRAEVERAVAELAAAKAETDKALADKAAAESKRTAAAELRVKLIGPEAEYQRRTRIANRMFDASYDGPTLTNEEATELAKWTATRELEEPFQLAADQAAAQFVEEQINGQRQTWARQALTVADEIGLPRDELREPDLGPLLRTTADVVTARIRATEVKPLQDTISQQEATIKDLETKLAHSARMPVIGGRSDGGLVPGSGTGWDPALPWDANLTRGLGSNASAGAR